MKNIIFIALMAFFYSNPIMAQNNRQEKRLLKSLKKEYGLNDAYFKRSWIDNYAYIVLWTKDGDSMIADSLGNIIIPDTFPSQKKYTSIEYVPERKKGYERSRYYNSTENCYFAGNKGCFVAKDNSGTYFFIDRNGTVISEFSGTLHDCYSVDAYLAISNIDKNQNASEYSTVSANNVGLLSKDGTAIIPTEYSEINTTNSGLCYVTQKVEGILKHGAINIANTTEYTNVPCKFNKVILSENGHDFLVRTHELDTFSLYSPDSVYSYSYIDEGERLFESKQYEEVHKYYSIINNNAPWANAYLGASCWKLALSDYETAERVLEELGRTINENGQNMANTVYRHLDIFEDEAKQAVKYLEMYLQGCDERYKPKVKEINYELTQIIKKSVILRNSVSHVLNAYKDRRNTYLEEERNEQIRKENERRFQQEQQRINNQRLHEINERNRIALERENARRRAEEKRKAEQKRKETSRTNTNVPPSQPKNNRWSIGSNPTLLPRATSSKTATTKTNSSNKTDGKEGK